jgi:hypothetical protein
MRWHGGPLCLQQTRQRAKIVNRRQGTRHRYPVLASPPGGRSALPPSGGFWRVASIGWSHLLLFCPVRPKAPFLLPLGGHVGDDGDSFGEACLPDQQLGQVG